MLKAPDIVSMLTMQKIRVPKALVSGLNFPEVSCPPFGDDFVASLPHNALNPERNNIFYKGVTPVYLEQ